MSNIKTNSHREQEALERALANLRLRGSNPAVSCCPLSPSIGRVFYRRELSDGREIPPVANPVAHDRQAHSFKGGIFRRVGLLLALSLMRCPIQFDYEVGMERLITDNVV